MRKSLFCLVLVCAMMLGSCASTSEPTPQTPDGSGTELDSADSTPEETPDIPILESDNMAETTPSSDNDERELDVDLIDSFFEMTKDEIIDLFGDYELIIVDPEGNVEGHHFVGAGLCFVFNYDDSVWWIEVFGNLYVRGSGTGMNFAQIQERLGETLIFPAWFEHEWGSNFFVEYKIGQHWYEFMSNSGLDGFVSRLRINTSSLQWNSWTEEMLPTLEDYIFVKGVACHKYLNSLSLNGIDLRDEDIVNLSGMERLQSLYLRDNKITDLAPLSNLTGLTTLWIDNNQIKDLTPLSKLTKLDSLALEGNPITDWSPVEHVESVWGRP
jgi:Leucine-rich repeat (LRR) protein